MCRIARPAWWDGPGFGPRLRRYGGIFGLLLAVTLLGPWLSYKASGSEITINWGTPRQVIDGFGASETGYTRTFTKSHADEFFSVSSGLGLSLLRVRAIPGTVNADCGCVANDAPSNK